MKNCQQPQAHPSRCGCVEKPTTQEYVLKAMAHNYKNGHSWDHLDTEAVSKGAKEISDLRLQCGGMQMEIDELKQVIKELLTASQPVATTAYNLGQSHDQRESISERIQHLDNVRAKASKMLKVY